MFPPPASKDRAESAAADPAAPGAAPKAQVLEELRRQMRNRLRGGTPRQRTKARFDTMARPLPASAAEPEVMARRLPASAAEPVRYRRDQPLAASAAAPLSLEEAAPGRVVQAPHGGQAWEIAGPIASLDEEWAGLNARFPDALLNAASHLNTWTAALRGGGQAPVPEDLLFLDIETTGLSSSPLFLVGTIVWENDGLVARQFFARDYSEERAAISLFHPLAAGKSVLVTFNGKSFDAPFLRGRAAVHGVPFPEPPAHLDLLHVGRRTWGRCLPDCKLQTIERHVCGRMRRGDIPSSEIPEAYHEFVRTGDAALIGEILRHNLLDLITLADLLVRLPGP